MFHDAVCLERKILMKRIKALKEDKKHDPAVLARLEGNLLVLVERKINSLLNILRLKYSLTKPFSSFM